MTTQLTTSNFQGSPTGSEVVGVSPPSNFPDEQHFHDLPLNFLLPCQILVVGHSSGLNLDLPVGTPPHPPQPAEPFCAQWSCAQYCFQKSLNPEYPEHIPNFLTILNVEL
jgi:cysteine desulfurase/selenocysteine lyase